MKQLIWDLPTRFFHWLLFSAVLGAFTLAELVDKDSPTFYFHVVLGVLAGLLVVWRIVWGFFGSKHARWGDLFFAPSAIAKYFKDVFYGKDSYYAGHNPGSAIVILGILSLVIATVFTGILNAQAEIFEELHEALPILLMVFVGFHVMGILLATKMNKVNYTLAMITGYKKANLDEAIKSSYFPAVLIMLVLVFGPWAYFVKGFDRNTGLFKAPGTQWTFQIGEPEAKAGHETED